MPTARSPESTAAFFPVLACLAGVLNPEAISTTPLPGCGIGILDGRFSKPTGIQIGTYEVKHFPPVNPFPSSLLLDARNVQAEHKSLELGACENGLELVEETTRGHCHRDANPAQHRFTVAHWRLDDCIKKLVLNSLEDREILD